MKLEARHAKWLPTLQDSPQKGESILADYLGWLSVALSVFKCQALYLVVPKQDLWNYSRAKEELRRPNTVLSNALMEICALQKAIPLLELQLHAQKKDSFEPIKSSLTF